MEPIIFTPLYKERVWGGRGLERTFGRKLPEAGTPYGESWEIVDRPEAQSVAAAGEFAGRTLHDLWTRERERIFGSGYTAPGFPILVKILDARDDLSIQVHPTCEQAAAHGEESKTEMWYVVDHEPGAKLHLGLRRGVTRQDFERAIADGTVADCVHNVEPDRGSSVFIPSGCVHAIGAGFLIFEVQQNSDTTYRVFDWNRPGLDGKPRPLHVAESLASIDFTDFEPEMTAARDGLLAECEFFRVERVSLAAGAALDNPEPERFMMVGVAAGALETSGGVRLGAGSFALVPRGPAGIRCAEDAVVLRISVPLD